MSVKLRLARRGRRKKPFYHIVAADARAPRDGRFIEKIGTYNPLTVPATIDLDKDRAFEWLQKGAQPTDTVRSILRFKGVLYRKHLMRGVAKGAMTEEQANKLYEEFAAEKDAKIQARVDKSQKDKEAYLRRIGGTRKEVEIAEEAPTEEAPTEEVVADESAPEVDANASEEVVAATENSEEVAPESSENTEKGEDKEEGNTEEKGE